MGLRGCTVLLPLMGAMFFPQWVTPRAGMAASVLGPLSSLLWHFLYPHGADPIYPGLLVSFVTLVAVELSHDERDRGSSRNIILAEDSFHSLEP